MFLIRPLELLILFIVYEFLLGIDCLKTGAKLHMHLYLMLLWFVARQIARFS